MTTTSNTTVPLTLTEEQLAFFKQNSYLAIENIFTDEDLQPVIDEVSEEVDREARKLFDRGDLPRLYEDETFKYRMLKLAQHTDRITEAIAIGQLSGPAFFDLIRHPKLTGIAKQFCGPELIASSVYRLRVKLPHDPASPVPWHQDSGYVDPYCDRSLMLTCWIPLVDATEENGCLWVIPGRYDKVVPHAHRKGKNFLTIPKNDLPDPDKAIAVPVPKGGILLLTNLIPHASFENKSDHVRWSMDLRYQSTSLPTNADITPLEHESPAISSEVDMAAPPACYPPEADFLVASEKRPQQVVTDPQKFHHIRNNHLAKPWTSRWDAVIED